MFNKYIALSALACAALLPLGAQAQSNSADADVNITLVDPIAVSYQANSGSLGSVVVPDGYTFAKLVFANRDDAPTITQSVGTTTFLEDPKTFDFTVTGGAGLGFSFTTSYADFDSDDGVSIIPHFSGCDGPSGFVIGGTLDNGGTTSGCSIQSGTTKIRSAPSIELNTASAMSDTKVATLTVAVAYE